MSASVVVVVVVVVVVDDQKDKKNTKLTLSLLVFVDGSRNQEPKRRSRLPFDVQRGRDTTGRTLTTVMKQQKEHTKTELSKKFHVHKNTGSGREVAFAGGPAIKSESSARDRAGRAGQAQAQGLAKSTVAGSQQQWTSGGGGFDSLIQEKRVGRRCVWRVFLDSSSH